MIDRTDMQAIAPSGVLRVALNHGNPVLVGRDDMGAPIGITPDLARGFAQSRGLALRFINFDRAVDVSACADQDAWDLAFLAVDPTRAETIAFSDPYLRIEGCYLAGPACAADDAWALALLGVPVGCVRGSAYTLTLQRLPGAKHLVAFESFAALLSALDDGRVAAIAGIRQVMAAQAATRPGARLLEPPFMEIRQAMAVPRTRPAALKAVTDYLDQARSSGELAAILRAHDAATGPLGKGE